MLRVIILIMFVIGMICDDNGNGNDDIGDMNGNNNQEL